MKYYKYFICSIAAAMLITATDPIYAEANITPNQKKRTRCKVS